MDGGAAAAIEVLVQTLVDVSKEEISLIRGLNKDVEQLQTTLGMIQSYLNDAEKKVITQEAVKNWLRELETLAFRADNVFDEFNYHLLHKQMKMPITCKVLPSFFSSFKRNVAQTIKQIDMDFNSLTQKSAVFGLEAMVVNAPAAVPDVAFETDSLTLDPIFIGRDDDVPKLVSNLTESPGEQFSIVAVVGMGGLGKTTLARKVFHHESVKTRFGSHIWVHVSQTFDPNMIFKKIIASQTGEAESREEENIEVTGNRGAISEKFKKSFKAKTDEVEIRQEIVKKLEKALKEKTYLLVLDDIWNEDVQKWDDFVNALSGVTSMKGNGIILTTRNAQVASIGNPLHTHHLNGLTDEDCWSIIKTKAYGNKDVPSEFETTGKMIARRCQGLPLTAKVVGGVLRDKSEQEWLSIQQKWLTDVEGDNISKILRLSFDNLSSPQLKKCFAYCSVFPKGDRIVKQELIELWMAEGFLQPDRRNDMESVGENFVKILLQNSLLQVGPRDDDEKEEVVIITLSSCHECEEIPTLGHLPNLKSLYLGRLRNVKSINSSFYGICQDTTVVFPALERLSLSNMNELKEWAEVEFPSSTNEIGRCEVKVFPHLQHLMMEECKQLRSVPRYFSTCLKRLSIRSMKSYMYLGNICGIKLTSLTKLEIDGLDVLECLPDWLFYNNQNLSDLKIISCHMLGELPDGLHTLNYLEELTIDDCPNLKSIGYPSGGGQS